MLGLIFTRLEGAIGMILEEGLMKNRRKSDTDQFLMIWQISVPMEK